MPEHVNICTGVYVPNGVMKEWYNQVSLLLHIYFLALVVIAISFDNLLKYGM